MRIEVRLFAQAREHVGSAQARLELPDGSRASHALDALQRTYPALAGLRPHLALAIDGTLARPTDVLNDGCELALLPPVSGG